MFKAGGDKRLFVILAAALACLTFMPHAAAEPFPIEPYISIDIPQELDFGAIPHPGNHVFTPTFSMHLAANIPYHVEISLSTLTHTGGNSTITPTNLQMLNPISSNVGTPIGGEDVDVQLQFNIETTTANTAGTYNGTLTVTAVPGP